MLSPACLATTSAQAPPLLPAAAPALYRATRAAAYTAYLGAIPRRAAGGSCAAPAAREAIGLYWHQWAAGWLSISLKTCYRQALASVRGKPVVANTGVVTPLT